MYTTEKCLSTGIVVQDIDGKIKQLNHEFIFLILQLIDPNVMVSNPINEFNNWYEDVNRIQQLQTTPDQRFNLRN